MTTDQKVGDSSSPGRTKRNPLQDGNLKKHLRPVRRCFFLCGLRVGVHLVTSIVPQTLDRGPFVVGGYVGVAQGRSQVTVQHPLLHGPRVDPPHKSMASEGVA